MTWIHTDLVFILAAPKHEMGYRLGVSSGTARCLEARGNHFGIVRIANEFKRCP